MRRLILYLFAALLALHQAGAQVYSNKPVGNKHQQYIDSLKKTEYPYVLPIWGKKAAKMGFDLPYSAGLGLNYLYQESDIIIEDLLVGFNNGPMYNIEEIVRIKNAVATASGLNLRPDIWLFPFLNIYGLFTISNTSTAIDAGVYIPDTTNTWNEIASFSSVADFKPVGYGFGLTPTLGVAGGFMAFDMNVSWQNISALDKPVFTFVFGPRMGKSFKFKNHPQSNIAFWVGGFRLHIKSETSGSLPLNEVLPIDEIQAKVDAGMDKVESGQEAADEWWNGLTPQEQKNPINAAKYETANRVLETAGNTLTSIDAALNDDQTASVQYSLNKRPKDMWNFVLGSQLQINKHYMVRVEAGFLGSRTQIITGLQYRFGL